MRFGVNYTPRSGWFHHWLDFSADEVSRDLDAIAELGVDHIRIFPLWPVLQPNRTLIRGAALDDLERVLELAAGRGLDVCVDGLQGHLSSFDFVPAWLTSWHRRNIFTDPAVVEATAACLRAVARAASGHPNLMAVAVGNEINQFSGGVHPEPNVATREQAGAWLEAMVGAIRDGAPDALAVHSCYDATWYDDQQPFTPRQAATIGDLTVVHSWVFNGTAQQYGPDAFETAAHARYLAEIARAFQSDPGREVWVQEIGAPRNVLPDASVAGFVERTFAELMAAPGLFGITWWSSHDISPDLADFPEFEYSLGLIDQQGRVKPEGALFRDLIAQARRAPASPSPDDPVAPTLVLDPAEGRAQLAPGGSFWNAYLEIARAGAHPLVTVKRT